METSAMPRRRANVDLLSQRIVLCALVIAMGIFILGPLLMIVIRSVTDETGAFVGLRNFARYFSTPSLLQSLINTLIVGTVTTAGTVLLAFPYAYAITRSRSPLRKVFLVLSMVPLYAPTMLYGIGLVYLFGNQGLITHGFFGRLPIAIDIHLYGLVGIILAEILITFPTAVLVLTVSLSHTDRRLYDAAASMGASAFRTFRTITLPGCRLGLLSASSIAFILSVTDFGAPKVLGAKTGVLATDIYSQVIGQQDFSMGAAISLVLLVPSALACGLEMFARRRQSAMLTARSVPLIPHRRLLLDTTLFVYCCLVTGAILAVTLTPALVSFVRNWPYSLSNPHAVTGSVFTMDHFNFDLIGAATGGGFSAYYDSLLVAGITVIVGTAGTFLAAYLVEKTPIMPWLRSAAGVMAIVPLGLPGLVLGLAFSLLFSRSHWGPFPNPMAGIYGTLTILVACNIVHFLGVSFLTARSALKQLDDEFEQVAASLAVSGWRLLLRVTLPICMPALLEIGMYYFVSATTTISAVIFLYSATTPLAAVAVINLDDAGWTQSAAAMSVMILTSNLLVRIAIEPLQRFFRHRTQQWRGAV
jgi:iron(III) transport system permease protein